MVRLFYLLQILAVSGEELTSADAHAMISLASRNTLRQHGNISDTLSCPGTVMDLEFQSELGTPDVEVTHVTGTGPEMDEMCCSHCQASPDCEFWVRDTQSPTCWLKKNFWRHPILAWMNTNRRGAFKAVQGDPVPPSPAEPPAQAAAQVVSVPVNNSTIPCETAVWTQSGIDELTSEGNLMSFGYPIAGTTLTASKRARINNMDGAITEGYIYCFGEGSDWDVDHGFKCNGRHANAQAGKSVLECAQQADAGDFPFFQYQPRTGRCQILGRCSSKRVDKGWGVYERSFEPWDCIVPERKCSGKVKFWRAVHSLRQCQIFAEEAGAAYFSYKEGTAIRKCAVTDECRWLPANSDFTVHHHAPCSR